MADQTQEAGPRQQDVSRRQERAQRILDAAAVLVLRWGYQKTTLEDISRQAGVAKATIYLHWKTRDELLRALIKREKLEMAEDLKQRIRSDPEGSTLRGILKHSALALMQRPLLKAVLLCDIDVLGKLAHKEHNNAAYIERMSGFMTYYELLREQGLVRTDLSLRVQVYIFSAIFAGFFLVAPLMPDDFLLSDEEVADMMAETVHCTLEAGRSFPSAALHAASRTFTQYLDHETAIAQEQFQQEVE